MCEPYEHRAPTQAELRADLSNLASWLTEELTNAANAMQMSRWADAAGEAATAAMTETPRTDEQPGMDAWMDEAQAALAVAYPIIAAAVLAEAEKRITDEAEREKDGVFGDPTIGQKIHWDGVTTGKRRAALIVAALRAEVESRG